MKDYVNAKILYCHPPPDTSEDSFNARTHELALLRAADKKLAPVTRVSKGADTWVPSNVPLPAVEGSIIPVHALGTKSRAVDQSFFNDSASLGYLPFVQGSALNGKEVSRARLFPHQNTVANDGTALGPQTRMAAILTNTGVEPGSGKKHFKKRKGIKVRSGGGYDL